MRIRAEEVGMLREERHGHILDALRRHGKVVVGDLSGALAVSADTIRRDLRELADAGLVQRVHGGALPRSPAVADYVTRQALAPAAKAAIGRAAAALVRPGQVVLLDGGTTTLQVAQQLPGDLRATIVTTSPPIAVALAAHPTLEVILIGGRLSKVALVTVGGETVAALGRVRADLCLLGVCSLHPAVGLSVDDAEEAATKRAMIAGAAEVVAMADAEKLGTAASFVVGPLGELRRLVTEAGIPDEVLAPYRAAGITIVQAG